jgi:hypothetical protein
MACPIFQPTFERSVDDFSEIAPELYEQAVPCERFGGDHFEAYRQ